MKNCTAALLCECREAIGWYTSFLHATVLQLFIPTLKTLLFFTTIVCLYISKRDNKYFKENAY